MKVDVADQMSLTSKHRPSADSGDIAPLPIDDDIRPYRTAYGIPCHKIDFCCLYNLRANVSMRLIHCLITKRQTASN